MRSFHGQAMRWQVEADALEVWLHREPLNEIGTTALEELERLAEVIGEGALGARAVILYSDRRGFCAGADLRELHAGMMSRASRLPTDPGWMGRGIRRLARPLVRSQIRSFLERIHRAFDAIDTAPITVIAAVHGVCFGGGFELALTSDLIVADKTARFCFPELRLGLIPGFGGIPRLERDVGNAVVRDLLLTGRSINPRRAHEVGLVHQVVPRGRSLEVARSVAAQQVRFDAHAVATAKRFAKPLPKDALARERDMFCDLVTRPAVLQALTRFVESDDLRPYL